MLAHLGLLSAIGSTLPTQEEVRSELIRRWVFMLPASRFEYTFLTETQSILGVATALASGLPTAAAAVAAPAGTHAVEAVALRGFTSWKKTKKNNPNVSPSCTRWAVIMIPDYVFFLGCFGPPSSHAFNFLVRQQQMWMCSCFCQNSHWISYRINWLD